MLRLIELLNHKNHYLEKFYSANEEELVRFSQGNFENLAGFYDEREQILEIIRYVDSEIDHEQLAMDPTEPTPGELRSQIAGALAIKDEFVKRILEQDLVILSQIEVMKSNIIKELQEIQKSKKAMGKYRSPSFHHRLDEEA